MPIELNKAKINRDSVRSSKRLNNATLQDMIGIIKW